jgi:hypothetical protein
MIGHQAQSQHPARNPLQALAEDFQERLKVAWLVEDSRPPVGAVEHMVHHSARRQSSGPAHDHNAAGIGSDATDLSL